MKVRKNNRNQATASGGVVLSQTQAQAQASQAQASQSQALQAQALQAQALQAQALQERESEIEAMCQANTAQVVSELKTALRNPSLSCYNRVMESVVKTFESLSDSETKTVHCARSFVDALLQLRANDSEREKENNTFFTKMIGDLSQERELVRDLESQVRQWRMLAGGLKGALDPSDSSTGPAKAACEASSGISPDVETAKEDPTDCQQTTIERVSKSKKKRQRRANAKVRLEQHHAIPCPANALATVESQAKIQDGTNPKGDVRDDISPKQPSDAIVPPNYTGVSRGDNSSFLPTPMHQSLPQQYRSFHKHLPLENYLLPMLFGLAGYCVYICMTARQEKAMWLKANGLTRKHLLAGLAGHHWSANGCPGDAQYM